MDTSARVAGVSGSRPKVASAAARKYFGDEYARVRFVPQGGGR